jgi:hypothetical protein
LAYEKKLADTVDRFTAEVDALKEVSKRWLKKRRRDLTFLQGALQLNKEREQSQKTHLERLKDMREKQNERLQVSNWVRCVVIFDLTSGNP